MVHTEVVGAATFNTFVSETNTGNLQPFTGNQLKPVAKSNFCNFDQTTRTQISMIEPPKSLAKPIHVPEKLLMGPGPSNCSKRVLDAQALPTIGHPALHKEMALIMDDIKEGIRYIFQTKNSLTLALSSTGHSGMECVMANILEHDDVVLIAENGIWGERAGFMASRQGADVRKVLQPPGKSFPIEQIKEAIETHKPKLFFLTHGESSTGVVQDINGIGDICKKNDCLFAVDTVASLGGVEINMDAQGVDILYTGSQKVLGCPPGLAPISFSDAAVRAIKARNSPPKSFYLDINWLGKVWDCFHQEPRVYHYTSASNQLFALREGLAIIAERGLKNSFKAHKECAQHLYKGLERLGLELFVENEKERLPTVTPIKVPEGIDWKAAVIYCNNSHMIEVAGGLGPTAGKVWRVGIMGENAKIECVDRVLKALEDALADQRK